MTHCRCVGGITFIIQQHVSSVSWIIQQHVPSASWIIIQQHVPSVSWFRILWEEVVPSFLILTSLNQLNNNPTINGYLVFCSSSSPLLTCSTGAEASVVLGRPVLQADLKGAQLAAVRVGERKLLLASLHRAPAR
jgi:hypothetical protein